MGRNTDMLTTRVRVYVIVLFVVAVLMMVASGVYMVNTRKMINRAKSTMIEYRSLKPSSRKYLGDKPLLGLTVAIKTKDIRSEAFYQVLLDKGAQRANKLVADFIVGHDFENDLIIITDRYDNSMSKHIQTIFFAIRYGREIAQTLGREMASSKSIAVKTDLSPEEEGLVKIERDKIKKLDSATAKLGDAQYALNGEKEQFNLDKRTLYEEKAGFTQRKNALEKREAQFAKDRVELDRKRNILHSNIDNFSNKKSVLARDEASLAKAKQELENTAKQLTQEKVALLQAKIDFANEKKQAARTATKKQ